MSHFMNVYDAFLVFDTAKNSLGNIYIHQMNNFFFKE